MLEDLRGLEQEDPPVSSAQVKHIGSLAVVCCLHSQRVVDGHSILQILITQLLMSAIFTLKANQSRERY